nr:tRNA pseudouridine(13) synthase TruD [Candidatus Sigynarchaeota archaeon]
MDDFSYENVVGIRYYVTKDLPGIGGHIKNLISDFIVQEITEDKSLINTSVDGNDAKSHAVVDDEARGSTSRRKPHKGNRKYTKFVLKKFGCDTIYAIEFLANRLNIPSELFTFAGIKDNQAITAQQVTVEGDFWNELVAIARAGDTPNFEIKDVDYANEAVKTGNLWGNRFVIRIRNIELDREGAWNRTLGLFKELEDRGGFLNYFGLQRFGTHRPNSHVVGKCLIKEDYQDAVYQLLVPSFPQETPEAVAARKMYAETNDPVKTREIMPESLYYEHLLLDYLASHPEDYKGAILALPKTIVSIYIYSYQSYLFNEVVSLRMEQLGADLVRPMRGDLVSLLDVRHGQITRVRYAVDDSNIDMLAKHIGIGKAVITVPIIGTRVRVSEKNPFYELYEQVLQREGMTRQEFTLDQEILDLSLKGVFRPLAIFPRNLRLIDVTDDNMNPSKQMVRLTFELPKGTYATMFLRELMKKENQYL